MNVLTVVTQTDKELSGACPETAFPFYILAPKWYDTEVDPKKYGSVFESSIL